MPCDLPCSRDRGANREDAHSIRYHLIIALGTGITSGMYAGMIMQSRSSLGRVMSRGDCAVFGGILAILFGYNMYAAGRCASRIADRS